MENQSRAQEKNRKKLYTMHNELTEFMAIRYSDTHSFRWIQKKGREINERSTYEN